MTKNVHFLKQNVLSLTGQGLKDKIDKVVNRLNRCGLLLKKPPALHTHIKEINYA